MGYATGRHAAKKIHSVIDQLVSSGVTPDSAAQGVAIDNFVERTKDLHPHPGDLGRFLVGWGAALVLDSRYTQTRRMLRAYAQYTAAENAKAATELAQAQLQLQNSVQPYTKKDLDDFLHR